MDPAELRRKNYIPPEAMPFKTSLTFTYDCGEFEKGMDLALKMADWDGFAKRKAESKKNGKLRGLGMSNTIERAAAASLEGAEIRFDRGGTVQIFSGSINQGQGHETTFKQVVADKLGVHPNDIEYIQGDTDKVFFGEGTGGSRSATMSGSAFYQAGEKVIAKAKAIAAHNMKVDVADINFDEGIFSSTKTNQTTTIKDVAQDASIRRSCRRTWRPACSPPRSTRRTSRTSRTASTSARSRSIPETGKVEVVKYNVVDDVGTVMNPLLLKGQIVGGVAMGVGQILKEDINFDADGQLTTGSFMDYAMPRAHDFSRDRGQGQSGADQDQPDRRQGRGRSRLRRRDAGGGERAGQCARRVRRQAHRDAGDAGAGVAGDRQWEGWIRTMAQMTHAEIKEKMIWAGKVLVNEGQDDFTRGHISVRLPDNPSLFFMKCHSVGLDEITAENILTIDLEGKVVAGTSRRHSEVYIHSEIFKVRPDVHCILHTHPLYSIVWSGGGRPLKAISQPAALFHNAIGIYTDTINLIRSHEMGAGVAQGARAAQRGDAEEPRHRHRGADHRRGGDPHHHVRERRADPSARRSRRRHRAAVPGCRHRAAQARHQPAGSVRGEFRLSGAARQAPGVVTQGGKR